MRILHCIDSIDPARGGPVQALRDFTARSGTGGIEIEVLTTDGDISQWAANWAVPVHAVGRGISAYRYNPGTAQWLRAHAAEFDAVVSHGIWTHQVVAVWQALRNTATPYFVYVHGMLNPWFKATYPLKHVKKALFWHSCVHSALRDAAAVLFLSHSERVLASESFKIDDLRIEQAPLGIRRPPTDDAYQTAVFLEKCPKLRGRRFILFFGRICAVKGCDGLLRAFAKVSGADPACDLVMCGPDSEGLRPQLMALAAKLGIQDRVHWPGPAYGDLKWGVLRSADALILPSHCEASPVAVMEALACKLPVLITDKVNIWQTIYDSQAGMISADQMQSVADCLGRWLRMDSTSRQRYRDNAGRCFTRNFEVTSDPEPYLKVIAAFRDGRLNAPVVLA